MIQKKPYCNKTAYLLGRVGLEGVAVLERVLGARFARHEREQRARRLTRRVRDAPEHVGHAHALTTNINIHLDAFVLGSTE
jgi:hypothetical protein